MTTGLFSTSLLEIEIQLDDLIEKAGGIDGVRLLDRLAGLPQKERGAIIKKFLGELEAISHEEHIEAEERPRDLETQNTKPSRLRFYIIDGGLQSKTKRAV
jgi:hypothetical protein